MTTTIMVTRDNALTLLTKEFLPADLNEEVKAGTVAAITEIVTSIKNGDEYADYHSAFLDAKILVRQDASRARRAAARGASILDAVIGRSWWREVNIDDLDMTRGNACMIGQLYGSWNDGGDQFMVACIQAGQWDRDSSFTHIMMRYGFLDHYHGEDSVGPYALKRAWIEIIESRVSADCSE